MARFPQSGPEEGENLGLGQLYRSVGPRVNAEAYLDADGIQDQSSVIAIGGATNDGVYTVRIQSTTSGFVFDESYSYTADASATVAEIRDGLIALIQADSASGILISDVAAGTASITLAGASRRTFSVSFTSNPNTDLSVTSTAPGYTQFYFGRAFAVAPEPDANVASKGASAIVIPTVATLVLSVDTNANSETSTVVLSHSYSDGQPSGADTLVAASGASASATATALGAAAEALWPNATVEVASPDVTVSFPAGESVAVVNGPTNTGSLVVTAVTTAAGAVPGLRLCLDSYDVAPVENRLGVTSVAGPIPGLGGVLGAAPSGSSEYVIDAPGTLTAGSRAYCDADGVFYDSPAVDRVPFKDGKIGKNLDSLSATLEY